MLKILKRLFGRSSLVPPALIFLPYVIVSFKISLILGCNLLFVMHTCTSKFIKHQSQFVVNIQIYEILSRCIHCVRHCTGSTYLFPLLQNLFYIFLTTPRDFNKIQRNILLIMIICEILLFMLICFDISN